MKQHYKHQSTFARKLGPHSKRSRMARMDLRTVEARFLKAYGAQIRAELPPAAVTPLVETLIDRCARLALLAHLFENRPGGFAGLAENDERKYITVSNALARCLQRLAVLAGTGSRRLGTGPKPSDYAATVRAMAEPKVEPQKVPSIKRRVEVTA